MVRTAGTGFRARDDGGTESAGGAFGRKTGERETVENLFRASGDDTERQVGGFAMRHVADPGQHRILDRTEAFLLRRLDLLPPDFPRRAADVPELTGELHNAVIGFLASTPSSLLLVNQEDLTKEVEQQNLPGTTWQYPNWSRKMKFSVEQLFTEKMARDFTAMFRHWLIRSRRMAAKSAAGSLPGTP